MLNVLPPFEAKSNLFVHHREDAAEKTDTHHCNDLNASFHLIRIFAHWATFVLLRLAAHQSVTLKVSEANFTLAKVIPVLVSPSGRVHVVARVHWSNRE